MKVRIWLQAMCLVVAAVAPVSLFAQFQAPTDEELKMTLEPKAPGAAAIYLYREETVNDNLHFHSFYARIKVLSEKGKELATVGVPYPRGTFQVTDVKARTIHADGTVIPLDVKPSDLVEHKGTGIQINKMVFTLPSVEVGSILEYRWQLRYDDNTLSSPYWEVQQPYFVRKAHYLFTPFRNLDEVTNSHGEASSKLLYSSMLPNGVKVISDPTGRYMLDVTDVEATPKEEYMPPLGSLMEQVQFYYSPYYSKEDYWKHEGERWSKEMDHFANQTGVLKGAVAGIIAPGDSEDARARKIYDAVMKLDNTDYTRRKSQTELKEQHLKEIRNAENVWTQKGGSSDEIALLYLAMARIAGLKAHAMTVCDRTHEIFNPYFMSISQFDDVLVLVTIDGKEIPLDPGKKFAPFGQLDWKHSLVSSLRQGEKGPELSGTPGNSYKDAVVVRVATLNIGRDGSVSGTARVTMNGPTATRWRELAIQNDPDEVKKLFNEEMRGQVPDGVTAELDHFVALDDYHTMLMAVVNISGNMGTATGKRVFLPGVFFESRAKHPFVSEEKRMTAVDMEYAENIQEEVTYHLPDGLVVESAPPDASIPWPGHAAFLLKSMTKNNEVTVDRTLARAFALLEAKNYSTLRDFYQKVAAADQQQLVLTAAPAPAAAGNGN